MTPSSAVKFLYDLQFFGMKAGLENITLLLDALGHPERSYPVIHIAGTNGKGSVSSMIASVLSSAGFKTGLYTSPHLVDFTERIRVDGKLIPRTKVIEFTVMLRPLIERIKATFFEATTAMAFQYFKESGVDVAVIETGLGGRLDATNVVTPMVSVITNIGFDHTEHLGNSLKAIAREKGGIIKKGVPIVTAEREGPAFEELARIARRKSSRLFSAGDFVRFSVRKRSLEYTDITFQTDKWREFSAQLSLAGDHQTKNAQTALAALQRLPDPFSKQLDRRAIVDGLAGVQRRTGLRARLEVVRRNPLIVVDVAHNPQGIYTSLRSLRSLLAGRWLIVFGVMADKNFRPMVEEIGRYSRLVIAVRPLISRALDSRVLVDCFHGYGARALDGGRVAHGLALMKTEQRAGEPVVILGSHFVAGEALIFLNSEN